MIINTQLLQLPDPSGASVFELTTVLLTEVPVVSNSEVAHDQDVLSQCSFMIIIPCGTVICTTRMRPRYRLTQGCSGVSN